MKRPVRWRLVSAGLLLLFLPALPQDVRKPFISSPRRLLTAPELSDAPDDWIDRSLKWVNYILDNYRPAIPEHPVRRAALIRMDDILHVRSAPQKPLVQNFYRERIEGVIREIESTSVTEGMQVWKLYNHGFVVRTSTVTFAFDIVLGTRTPGFTVPKELMERLTAQCDAAFITHMHDDHANADVARIFLAEGKPVIAPEGLWSDVPELATRLKYPARSTETAHSVPVRRGAQVLSVIAYPGHQDKAAVNNVYLVTSPEGFTVVQTGDQSGPEGPGSDFDWLAHIGRDHAVDVLLPNCWGNALGRTVRGVNPELIITGHENEMGHSVDHREDFTQTYNRLFGIRYPAIVMAWGEGYQYRRDPVGRPAGAGEKK